MSDLPAATATEEFGSHGMRLVAERCGEERSPITVLLLHGLGMGRRVFGDLVGHLAAHAFVVAVDLPGYGDAPEPAHIPSIEAIADLAADYLRGLGRGPAVVVGHSMGTQVATEVAARHPELVSHLVLVAPTVDPRGRRTFVQLGRLCRDLLGESPKVLYLGAREYLRSGPNLRRKVTAMMRHRPEDLYPLVQAPALVLRGGTDPVSPQRWCEQVTGLLPDARLVVIEEHGHETLISDARPAAAEILRLIARD